MKVKISYWWWNWFWLKAVKMFISTVKFFYFNIGVCLTSGANLKWSPEELVLAHLHLYLFGSSAAAS